MGRPSGYLTKSRPSASSVTGLSGPRNESTSCGVAVNGNPRIRIITWFSLDRNWATSFDVPGVKRQQWLNTLHHKTTPSDTHYFVFLSKGNIFHVVGQLASVCSAKLSEKTLMKQDEESRGHAGGSVGLISGTVMT